MKASKADKDAKRLIRIITTPIKIESKKYGNIELRPLSGGDFEFLSKIISLNLSAHDFAVKVIRRTLKKPRFGEKEIRAFPDACLTMIATKLIKDFRMNIKDLPKGKITLELFKQKIVEDHNEFCKRLMTDFSRHWPWINEFKQNQIPQMDKAEEWLERCGYRHTMLMLKRNGFRKFANLGPKTLDATVTKIWLRLTKRDSFKDELKERFQNSTILRRRWIIIEHAWTAHSRGDYILSIPALFSQIEGILGDALILNKKAKNKDGKLFLLDLNGSIKTENGKQIELAGILPIIDQPYFNGISSLEEIVKLLREDNLAKERNAILHGRKTLYGRAKLSTQLLLLVYVLIREAAEFEPRVVINN